MRMVKSVPEDQHADKDQRRENRITDKMIAVNALAATKLLIGRVLGINLHQPDSFRQ